MKSQVRVPLLTASRPTTHSPRLIRFFLAPLLGLFSGFHTMDFLLGGLYTWPQMSRVIALSLAMVIVCYEFVYKEHRDEFSEQHGGISHQGMKAVLYSCFVPYVLGALALLSLILLS